MGKLQKLIDGKNDSAKFMCDEIAHICGTMPKRPPGSEGELMACEHMANVAKDLGAERADIESFKENPNAFFGFLYFTISFALVGIVSFFRLPILGVACITIGLLIFILQFGFYKKIVDPFFPSATGHNVTILKKCSGEVKGRVFFNGHPDAVWRWPYHQYVNSRFNVAVQALGILGALIWLVLNVIASVKTKCAPMTGNYTSMVAVYGQPLMITAFVCLVFAIPLTMLYFMWDERNIVDGANDNLTGCYMGISVLKALKDAGIELEHTEVGVIISGSEEAGLRGALAWAKTHKDDFNDVPTWIYSFDTIREKEFLGVNYRDLNGTVKADKEVCDSFVNAANELGIKCQKTWVPPFGGSTDNSAFCKYGFKSAGITAMNHVLQPYYHTMYDTADNLDPECLADCFAVTVKALENFDAAVSGETAEAKTDALAEAAADEA